jgi:hypothetical protein
MLPCFGIQIRLWLCSKPDRRGKEWRGWISLVLTKCNLHTHSTSLTSTADVDEDCNAGNETNNEGENGVGVHDDCVSLVYARLSPSASEINFDVASGSQEEINRNGERKVGDVYIERRREN